MSLSTILNAVCRSFVTAYRCLLLPPYLPLALERTAPPHDQDDCVRGAEHDTRGGTQGRDHAALFSDPKAPNPVRVVLSGGPDWVMVPAVWEVRSVESEPKVKILCGNAYEHFEFSGMYSFHEGERLPVYRWCNRTYVAE
ncbi:DUF5988 family protein [Streptomyces anulatus]|uniref:DUF5988 family protein n=1 Tax=Streptomyces anulatus TaxID=1892 RepID=UPI0022776014|nr:DUF5988 family protein [Streptomyces anulatus]